MAKTSAAPLLLGAGAVAVMAAKGKKKKRPKGHWGIRVSKDCQLVEITNPVLFRDFLLGGYKELVEADPDLGVFQIASAMFGEVAPTCSPFPENPESPGVAELYSLIIKSLTGFMVADRNPKILAMMDNPESKEFSQWYDYWRNPPSPEIPEAPATEVAFASDLSQYRIGSDWYEGTVLPFVMAFVQANGAAQVYEAFITNRAVSIGRMILPIAELPAESPMIVQFIGQVQDAIARAVAETER